MKSLTFRDRHILSVLTKRVKLLTLPQIARTWWDGTTALQSARRRLQELEDRGLVERFTVYAHPELPLTSPLYCWTPPAPAPNFGALSYALVSRWIEPHRPVAAFSASKRTGIAFGGHGGIRPKRVEENHEVHLATVFLCLCATRPTWAESWQSEKTIRRTRPRSRGEKLPDALVSIDGTPTIIDFGGAYSSEKLKSFHGWARRKSLAYQIW